MKYIFIIYFILYIINCGLFLNKEKLQVKKDLADTKKEHSASLQKIEKALTALEQKEITNAARK